VLARKGTSNVTCLVNRDSLVFEPPRRPGIAYMLQGDVSAIDGRTEAVSSRARTRRI
jgi:hypothetical protein